MPKLGGWYKQFSDENTCAKVARMTDLEFRVWHTALNLCNQSPWKYRRQGLLYHSEGFPVTAIDFLLPILRGKTEQEIQSALERIQEISKESPLLILTEKGEIKLINWRKRQELERIEEDTAEKPPENLQTFAKKQPLKAPETAAQDLEVYSDLEKDLDKNKGGREGGSKSTPPAKPPKSHKSIPELSPDQERLWNEVWNIVSAIPGWPVVATEEKSRETFSQMVNVLSQLDFVREATKLKLWLLKNQHKKPSLRRWVNWMQIAEEKRLDESLRRDDNTPTTGAGAWPKAPEPAPLPPELKKSARQMLVMAKDSGKLAAWKQNRRLDFDRRMEQAEWGSVEEIA